ncbi:MAG: hypothetical protein ACTSPY_04095 [Candidatus Helarchaeota archaeon]
MSMQLVQLFLTVANSLCLESILSMITLKKNTSHNINWNKKWYDKEIFERK